MGFDEQQSLKLPFIDFSSEPKPGTPCWDSLKLQLREALQEYGCFEASLGDSRVPGELRRDVFSSLEELFDLPLHTKQQSGASESFQDGYAATPNGFYQSFGIEDPNSLHSMAGVVSEFNRTVRRMLLESFGLEKYVEEHLSSTTYRFRVMKYEALQPLDAATEVLGLGVHTDKSFMTILCQNEVGGLKLQAKRGEWVKFAPTSPTSFVVLIGDALHSKSLKMGSDESLKLPFIDFSSELKPSTPSWDSLKLQVREALENYGCFEASFPNDKVPGELRRDVFSSLEELFDLPLHTKQQSGASQSFQHGYVATPIPFFQSFGMDDPNLLDVVETFTDTLWPHGGNPSFSNNIHSMVGVVSEFNRTVRRMILESFGLEKYVDEHLGSTKYHLRVMKYEAVQPHDETELGLRVHTDKSFMTILCQNEVEGLELQTKKGEWIKFRPTSPSSFVVLIGDALHVQ
ncbi:unnamed protein product [Linum tenue]|uniref:Uncharacterized protein n=1 Tax=Linum tenue TaxID=586396 RepID=A0AAV0NHG0_9ROSI|nr:unnamed protein product [Linum tenue]